MTTLEDMTPEQRAECVGMWCNYETPMGTERAIYSPTRFSKIDTLFEPGYGLFEVEDLNRVTPRFDLPRVWNPDGTPVAGNGRRKSEKKIDDSIRPEDVPVGEAWLVELNGKRLHAIKDQDGDWLVPKESRYWRSSSEVTLISPLVPAHSHNIANALAEAGLLAPDLPGPDEEEGAAYGLIKATWNGTHWVPDTDITGSGATHEIEVLSGVTAYTNEVWVDTGHGGELLLSPGHARSLGLALLAAANYAKKVCNEG